MLHIRPTSPFGPISLSPSPISVSTFLHLRLLLSPSPSPPLYFPSLSPLRSAYAYAAQKLNEEAETGWRLQHPCGGNTVKFRFRVRVPAHTIKKIKRPVRRKSQRSVFSDPYGILNQ
jgi:hypothetical protein